MKEAKIEYVKDFLISLVYTPLMLGLYYLGWSSSRPTIISEPIPKVVRAALLARFGCKPRIPHLNTLRVFPALGVLGFRWNLSRRSPRAFWNAIVIHKPDFGRYFGSIKCFGQRGSYESPGILMGLLSGAGFPFVRRWE